MTGWAQCCSSPLVILKELVDNAMAVESGEDDCLFIHTTLVPVMGVVGEQKTSISYSLSAGTGIHWSQISLDLAYTFRSWDRDTQFDLGSGLYLPAELKMRNHYLAFSFTGVF